MINYKEMDKSCFELYDSVQMNVDIRSEFRIKRIDQGLGGLLFEETPVRPYIKDLSVYERAQEYEKNFDISNWRFFMAFDEEKPVGAMTTAGTTNGMNMLNGATDACVLWDIRVNDEYKHRGIGKNLFELGIAAAKNDGYRRLFIECQNNNVTACKFYKKLGAVLTKVDMNAYCTEQGLENEVQFIWTLEIT